MTAPLPPSPEGLPFEIILPTGETGYLNPYSRTYTTKRDYGLRMQRNYARGIRQAEARGHKPSILGETESQRRRRLAIEQGTTPYQQRLTTWALRYPGMSYSWYQRIYRMYIAEINYRSSPDTRIGPSTVYAQLANSGSPNLPPPQQPPTGHTEEWVENQLLWRLKAMQDFQDEGDNEVGHALYVNIQLDPVPPEWWYYH